MSTVIIIIRSVLLLLFDVVLSQIRSVILFSLACTAIVYKMDRCTQRGKGKGYYK